MMRILTLLSAFVCALQIAKGQGHDIKITVTGIQEPSAIVGYHFGNQRLVLDTAFFNEKQSIQIKGEKPLPQGVYFVYTPTFYFEFLVHDQQFSLATTTAGGYQDVKVQNSPENESFKKFQVNMIAFQRQQREIQEQLKDAQNKEDSTSIYQSLDNLNQLADSTRKLLINERPGSFFSSFISMMDEVTIPAFEEIEDETERKRTRFLHYKNHYFDILPEPSQMMRTPMIHGYVTKYFNELVLTDPDSIIVEIDRWIMKLGDQRESFRYWLVTFYNKYQDSKIMGMDAVTLHLIEQYYLTPRVDWLEDKAKADLKDEIKFIKPNLIGKPAPMLNLVDSAMSPVIGQAIPADYIVLYFYDPDCGVCKKKTPVLKEQYPKIKELKGEVVAVCTITDMDKWKSYIRKNELNWINLADPKVRSNFRMDYNIRSTPKVYILDKERKIIAKGIDVDQVTDFINEHIKLMSFMDRTE